MDSKRVLIVDDEWENLECLQAFLQPEFEVVAACGGAAAIDSLRDEKFDAVMLDLTMPEVDGFEVMRFVHERFPDLPVMLASGLPELGRIAAELGAKDWVAKPYPMARLSDRLRSLLSASN